MYWVQIINWCNFWTLDRPWLHSHAGAWERLKYARASDSHCFKGDAGFSYCAAKGEKYYGFKGHVMVSSDGVICGYAIAAANVDELDVLPEMVAGLHSHNYLSR